MCKYLNSSIYQVLKDKEPHYRVRDDSMGLPKVLYGTPRSVC